MHFTSGVVRKWVHSYSRVCLFVKQCTVLLALILQIPSYNNFWAISSQKLAKCIANITQNQNLFFLFCESNLSLPTKLESITFSPLNQQYPLLTKNVSTSTELHNSIYKLREHWNINIPHMVYNPLFIMRTCFSTRKMVYSCLRIHKFQNVLCTQIYKKVNAQFLQLFVDRMHLWKVRYSQFPGIFCGDVP